MRSQMRRLVLVAAAGLLSPVAAAAAIIPSVSAPSLASGSVTLTALSKLKIFVDGFRVAVCTTSPCSYQWDTTGAANGLHTIVAKRVSVTGRVSVSPALTVTVDNADPAPVTCPVFLPDNAWNTDISTWPVHPNSASYLASIGGGTLHPDFGDIYGIPFTTVPEEQPRVPIRFYYDAESDPGPYPIPPGAPIEGGSDRHILVIDRDNCVLYEVFDAQAAGGHWEAGSGAIWNLKINATRPPGWTSADAAGLPIFAGLVRYDEVVEKGVITHALRFTVARTSRGYIPPASHFASSSTDPNRPPMGLRLRLKASFDISGFHPHGQVILQALKRYGMIVADNGSNWFITGARDERWDNEVLDQLKTVSGSHFEVVYTGEVVTD